MSVTQKICQKESNFIIVEKEQNLLEGENRSYYKKMQDKKSSNSKRILYKEE